MVDFCMVLFWCNFCEVSPTLTFESPKGPKTTQKRHLQMKFPTVTVACWLVTFFSQNHDHVPDQNMYNSHTHLELAHVQMIAYMQQTISHEFLHETKTHVFFSIFLPENVINRDKKSPTCSTGKTREARLYGCDVACLLATRSITISTCFWRRYNAIPSTTKSITEGTNQKKYLFRGGTSRSEGGTHEPFWFPMMRSNENGENGQNWDLKLQLSRRDLCFWSEVI